MSIEHIYISCHGSRERERDFIYIYNIERERNPVDTSPTGYWPSIKGVLAVNKKRIWKMRRQPIVLALDDEGILQRTLDEYMNHKYSTGISQHAIHFR